MTSRKNLRLAVAPTADISAGPHRARLEQVLPDGRLRVSCEGSANWLCDWLDTGSTLVPPLMPGDTVLVLPPAGDGAGVVLGRIGSYQAQRAAVVLDATESLSLRCGESSLEMRANGQVLLKGDDVLLRAKGTQRIRAGTVAIN